MLIKKRRKGKRNKGNDRERERKRVEQKMVKSHEDKDYQAGRTVMRSHERYLYAFSVLSHDDIFYLVYSEGRTYKTLLGRNCKKAVMSQHENKQTNKTKITTITTRKSQAKK